MNNFSLFQVETFPNGPGDREPVAPMKATIIDKLDWTILSPLSRMWYSWSFITNLERIFIHTKRAERCLAELNTQESWREAYRYQKYSHNNISVYYGSNPVCCSNLFPRRQDLHQHNTRNTSNCVTLAHHFITVFNWLKRDNTDIVKWYLDNIWIR